MLKVDHSFSLVCTPRPRPRPRSKKKKKKKNVTQSFSLIYIAYFLCSISLLYKGNAGLRGLGLGRAYLCFNYSKYNYGFASLIAVMLNKKKTVVTYCVMRVFTTKGYDKNIGGNDWF